MRGKLVLVIACAWLGGLVTSCMTPATDDELESMCDNLVQLRGEMSKPSVETIVSDITVRIDEQTTQLQDNQKREKRALNEEMQARLDEAEKDDEKAKIKGEFTAKLKAVDAKYQPGIDAMSAKKTEAKAVAQKQAAESSAAWNEAVNECVVQSTKEGVVQKVARCRMQADSTDKYWNGCR